MTKPTAPAPRATAFDAWHDAYAAALAARGHAPRDFDPSYADEAFTDGVAPVTAAIFAVAALDD